MRLTGTPPAYLINRMPSHEVRTNSMHREVYLGGHLLVVVSVYSQQFLMSPNACMCPKNR